VDRDDDEPHLPGERSMPTVWTLDGERPCIGTYTPPAPYRVFLLITGGAGSVEPTRPSYSDKYDCLTMKLRGSPHPHLHLVDESLTFESTPHLPGDTLQF
jgi:hypothetical protein